MKRLAVFLYGVISYVVFFATFLYAIGFMVNIFVPKSIDSGPTEPLGTALAINIGLLGVFAVQHSVMARQWFKRGLTKLIPEAAERSTYVLMSSLALMLLFWQWRPLGGVIWQVESIEGASALWAIGALGWLIVLASTFLINHFDLFGLRQVYLYLRMLPYRPLQFRTPFFYKYVRHPLYLGWLFAFWGTPTMTAAHLLFASMTTAYILVAIHFEEADLVRAHGEKYVEYQERVPMILPVRLPKEDTVTLAPNV